MAPTVAVNGLTLCHMGSGGVATSTLPDICKTPTPIGPIPIVYINVAMDSELVDGSETVHADGGNAIAVAGCTFSQSMGDEPGTNGGVISGVNRGEASFISFSPDVTVEGKAVCRLSDKMLMNDMNTACLAGIVIPPVVAGQVRSEEIEGEEEEGPISVCFNIESMGHRKQFRDGSLVLQSSDDNGAAYYHSVSLKQGGSQVREMGEGHWQVIFNDVLPGKRYDCLLQCDSPGRVTGAGNRVVVARGKYIGAGYKYSDS